MRDWPELSKASQQVVSAAISEAMRMRHRQTDSCHLLLALLTEDGSVPQQTLASWGVTYEAARAHVLDVLGTGETECDSVVVSPRATGIIRSSEREAQASGSAAVEPQHLLLALLASAGTADFMPGADPLSIRQGLLGEPLGSEGAGVCSFCGVSQKRATNRVASAPTAEGTTALICERCAMKGIVALRSSGPDRSGVARCSFCGTSRRHRFVYRAPADGATICGDCLEATMAIIRTETGLKRKRQARERRGGDDSTIHCSFCGTSQDDVRKLIAGPGICICDQCVDRANDVIEADVDAHPPVGTKCCFCGKTVAQVDRMVVGPDEVHICDECVRLCNDIIEEEMST